MSKIIRVFCYALLICGISTAAQAKYCVKLPSCEELGYIYQHKEGRREIKCPFDTSKVLLLDFCQAYGLATCDSNKGSCEQCKETKADGSEVSTEYYRYTRCAAGYTYQSGDCILPE